MLEMIAVFLVLFASEADGEDERASIAVAFDAQREENGLAVLTDDGRIGGGDDDTSEEFVFIGTDVVADGMADVFRQGDS